AGVVPHLDEEALGYRALRDRSAKGTALKSERDYPVVALRATNDLVGQLAPALAVFAARPWTYTTPTGRKVTIDLAALLGQMLAPTAIAAGQLNGAAAARESAKDASAVPTAGVTPQRLYAALRRDPGALARLLPALAARLPVEPVLVIEQAEELFSLSRSAADLQNRQHALAMLHALAEA